ncbi:Transcriptional regulator containing PAS, AAA-type ATPase, and DNA-binding Fis domains [Proteiniborus ethanoligenes]|uniref:Transcriptional regulator containing PAS, AAA-type ATPase, and DNA-binding Fis domains n=1 Tax=Proteiniborus ethanoligenes TaxID=415015 RepID=A0A1H3N9S3_9FIRM|nr:sigma 54-interacting transcriptional regulator [Proteiniborus ethanoligenes]SDY85215.1 Transcriptional regulator containing PAS, AAA-type ATPase, and DNA-binding Fis domains [Proteiniborus ethanoligenes]
MQLINAILDNMQVKDIMKNKILKVSKTDSPNDIIKRMKESEVDCVVITDNDERKNNTEFLIDFIDLINIIHENISLDKFLENNKFTELETIKTDDTVGKVISLFIKGYNKIIPVYDDNNIRGIICPKDMIIFYNNLLNKTQGLFVNILDNIHDAICVVNKDLNVLVWNKSAENLYKIEKENIFNRNIKEIFPSALLPRVLEEGNTYENIFNSPREGCYNIISAKPLLDNDEIIGGVSCDKDISELIRISELLNKTQLNLQVLEDQVSNLNESRFAFSKIIGNDKKFREIIEFSKNISKSTINVLITGESGTGKEVFARAIHMESGRKGYFVPINCSAIPGELMESELFGYKGGAFTGSSREGKAGKFELAHKGTIFLDEIGDMPLNMQPKILRVIEDGIITRIGSENSVKIDVRIIAATNKDLRKLMNEGLFRKDLYYRLNSVIIDLPPLRKRKLDVPLLANEFIKEFCISYGTNIIELPQDTMEILINHEWEGNIRELRNLIERIVILSKHNKFDISYLPNDLTAQNWDILSTLRQNSTGLNDKMNNKEKELILNALNNSNYNKKKAAEFLNIPRSTLYFKMKKHNIEA